MAEAIPEALGEPELLPPTALGLPLEEMLSLLEPLHHREVHPVVLPEADALVEMLQEEDGDWERL